VNPYATAKDARRDIVSKIRFSLIFLKNTSFDARHSKQFMSNAEEDKIIKTIFIGNNDITKEQRVAGAAKKGNETSCEKCRILALAYSKCVLQNLSKSSIIFVVLLSFFGSSLMFL
jgi:hypothetical protein